MEHAVEQANQADEQPRGDFGGIMTVGSAWLLAAYRQRSLGGMRQKSIRLSD
ncbi:MAG: hypothetical protein ACE1ZS_08640 [Candidatus Poribacteria bacterium]